MTPIRNPSALLAKRSALQSAYVGFKIRYTAAIKALVWSRGGK